jgi:hypothetical protein
VGKVSCWKKTRIFWNAKQAIRYIAHRGHSFHKTTNMLAPEDDPNFADGRREMAECLGETMAEVRPLPYIITMVAQRMEMEEGKERKWIQSVEAGFEDVGVHTLRQFVTNVVRLNTLLAARRHPQLRETTLRMLLQEACTFMMGPGGNDKEYQAVNHGKPLTAEEVGWGNA